MNPGVKARIESLQTFVNKVCSKDVEPEIASYLYKLGAIMACGTIERCVEIIILDKVSNRAHPRIVSFVRSYFKRGLNYDCNEIEQLLIRFDREWAESFKRFSEGNSAVKEGISSCYAIRNSVAHGGAQSLGERTLISYSEHAVTLIQALNDITGR